MLERMIYSRHQLPATDYSAVDCCLSPVEINTNSIHFTASVIHIRTKVDRKRDSWIAFIQLHKSMLSPAVAAENHFSKKRKYEKRRTSLR